MTDQTTKTLRWYLAAVTLFLYITAFAVPDRSEMLSGLQAIIFSPAQVTKDYFLVGSVSGTFLNLALVGTVCVALMFLPGAVVKGSTIAAYFLTMGFSTWGINILNIWPFMLGVFLCALVRRQKLSGSVDLAMFATGLCPVVSEMLLRYGSDAVHAPTALSALLALGVGGAVGFFTPALAAHSPSVHKGFDLYSAALPAGLMGFFIVAAMYKTAGVAVPPIEATLGEDQRVISFVFLGVLFLGSILAGFLLNGKSFKGYLDILTDSGHKRDYTAMYGPGLALINVGVYGLFIVAYYVLTGASFNGVTCGTVLCMVCFAAAGAHPGNVWPILVGYVLASFVGVNAINAQAIIAGACFASGLAPIAGVYGPLAGIVGGAAHYALVTSVPALHGGFCLYNGGFTSLLIALLLVPQLETFCKTREERLDARRLKRRAKREAQGGV